MKKLLNLFVILMFVLLSVTPLNHQVFAEDGKDSLISDLNYDKESHVLTGKTVPNANVSLADIVGNITANDEGNFSVPIPENLEKTTLTIMDFLNDQSTDINYNFVAQTIDTTAEHVVSQTFETTVSQTSSSAPIRESTHQPVTTNTPNKEPSILIWVVILVVIVTLTILAIFLVNKRKAEKQAELAQLEKRRSGRRKRRKKSTK